MDIFHPIDQVCLRLYMALIKGSLKCPDKIIKFLFVMVSDLGLYITVKLTEKLC